LYLYEYVAVKFIFYQMICFYGISTFLVIIKLWLFISYLKHVSFDNLFSKYLIWFIAFIDFLIKYVQLSRYLYIINVGNQNKNGQLYLNFPVILTFIQRRLHIFLVKMYVKRSSTEEVISYKLHSHPLCTGLIPLVSNW
jgi:hypothetical protein